MFAQRSNLFSPTFIGMLRDIMRFNGSAEQNLELATETRASMGELLTAGGYGGAFQRHYLLPMAAAIWSSATADILAFPATTFLRFCLNHALLQVNRRPQWRTVVGGGREYVKRIVGTLDDVRIGTPVRGVRRDDEGVDVYTDDGTERFDALVLATHAPTTLRLLEDADQDERSVLAARCAISRTSRCCIRIRRCCRVVSACGRRGITWGGGVSTVRGRCASAIWSISCSRCRSARRSSSRLIR